MATKVNLAGVSDSFEPVPEGIYEGALTGFKVAEAKSSPGQQYVSLEFTLAEGEFAGRKIWKNHSLQAQALWALKRTLLDLGADSEELEQDFDLEELLDTLKGDSVQLEVGQRTYEGKIQNDLLSIIGS